MRDRRTDLGIWLRTAAVVAVYAVAVAGTYRTLLGPLGVSPSHALVLALLFVQLVVVFGLLTGLIVVKSVAAARERVAREMEPAVREAMANALVDESPSHGRPELTRLFGRSPLAVERCAAEFLRAIEGSEVDRLSELVEELGLVRRWTRRARSRDSERRREAFGLLGRLADGRGNGALRRGLGDPEASVRMEAARGLLRSDRIADVERTFLAVTGEPLLVRAILVEELRPHAARLAEHAIPRVLRSLDPRAVLVALEMIVAWQKGVTMPGVGPLLRHPRPEVRARALQALPYVTGESDVFRETLTGLEDPDPGVRIAAAGLAGRIGLHAAVPVLGRLLHARDVGVAVEAAYALARIGPPGWEVLEREVRGPEGPAARAALEALERVRTGRLVRART